MDKKMVPTIVGLYLLIYRDGGKENGNYYNRVYFRVITGMMEKNMETTIVGYTYIYIYTRIYKGYIKMMEKKMEPTIVGYIYI